jgi:cyclic pyranopterin phosphate synthase
MPAGGVPLPPPSTLLTDDEYVRIARVIMDASRATPDSHPSGKIRLTGGEPLLHPTLVPLVGRLSALTSGTVGITTNGITLHRHIDGLIAANLGSINVSLDTVDPAKFRDITRRDALPSLLKSLHKTREATAAASVSMKLNVVVMKGFNDGPEDFAAMLAFGKELDVDVRFIEYMPFNSNEWSEENKYVPMASMLAAITETPHGIAPLQATDHNDTSKWFKYTDSAASARRVGFIASMSTPFCSSCNRLRITADGSLKVCLFSNTEVSLRDVLRDGHGDGDLLHVVKGALGEKDWRWGGSTELEELRKRSAENRAMTAIGG